MSDIQQADLPLVGRSPLIERVRSLIASHADTSANVLIIGETGTGKELVARCLHARSTKWVGKFLPIECGALSESTFDTQRDGLPPIGKNSNLPTSFELQIPCDGMIFFDGVQNLTPFMQLKLSVFLQDYLDIFQMSCLNSQKRFRVVSAANEGLEDQKNSGEFNSDLFYKLNVISIKMVPLRNRPEDIPLLFTHFTKLAASYYGSEVPDLSRYQFQKLMTYSWPGNLRELRNAAEKFVIEPDVDLLLQSNEELQSSCSLKEQVGQFERQLIELELCRHSGSVAKASEVFGLSKAALYEKIRKYGIDLDVSSIFSE